MRRRRWHLIFIPMCVLAVALLLINLRPAASVPSVSRAEDLGLLLEKDDSGLYVLALIDASPAYTCGIEPGDILTTLEGNALDSVETLDAILADLSSRNLCNNLHFTILRENGAQPVTLSLKQR